MSCRLQNSEGKPQKYSKFVVGEILSAFKPRKIHLYKSSTPNWSNESMLDRSMAYLQTRKDPVWDVNFAYVICEWYPPQASSSFQVVPASSIFLLVQKDFTKVKCSRFMAKKEARDIKCLRHLKRPRKVYFCAPMSWLEVNSIYYLNFDFNLRRLNCLC